MIVGKLIVIEGGDGAGKGTQSELARAALAELGEITYFDFPRYGKSIAGKIVGAALKGDYGDFLHMHPLISSLPYALDRVGAREEILAALEKGNVICNRYTPSNVMYQSAKFADEEEQEQIIDTLESLEYGELKLPVPDLVIYLHVPFHISRELVLQKAAREHLGAEQGIVDQHEADQLYQQAVIKRYLKTVEERQHFSENAWKTIECVQDGELLSREIIHEKVMDEICAIL